MLYNIGPDYFEIQYKTTSDFFACEIVKKELYTTYFILHTALCVQEVLIYIITYYVRWMKMTV